MIKKLTLISLTLTLVLVSASTSLAEDIQEGSYKASDVTEAKCKRDILPKLPYALKPKTREYYQLNSSNEFKLEPKANPGFTSSDQTYTLNDAAKISELAKACACKHSNQTLDPKNFGTETTDYTRYFWATIHLSQTCQYITNTKQSSVDGSGEKTINYCAIKPQVIKDSTLTLTQYKTADTDNDCKIDSNKQETCLVKLYKAHNKCDDPTQTNFSADGFTGSCIDLKQNRFQCVNKDTPEELLFNDQVQQDKLNTNYALTNKEQNQSGFIGFFAKRGNDQGAGADNPAINLILYIINLLAGLSFMIAVAMLIIGGFYLVMASGNSEMTDKGKQSIKNFVLAITFTLLSYAIVTIIQAIIYS